MTALTSTAVAVTQSIEHIQRAVKDVGPPLATQMPHREWFCPAIRVELDEEFFIGGCVFGNGDIEGDRGVIANLPGFDSIIDHGWDIRHDHLADDKISAGGTFGVPEPIAECIFVL